MYLAKSDAPGDSTIHTVNQLTRIVTRFRYRLRDRIATIHIVGTLGAPLDRGDLFDGDEADSGDDSYSLETACQK